MSDAALAELRDKQKHLRSVLDEYVAHDLPLPSPTSSPAESRRLIEVAIRTRCEIEIAVSADLIARIESHRCHELLWDLVSEHNFGSSGTENEPRFRAAEIVRSVAGELRTEGPTDDELAMLRRVSYLLAVADHLATIGA